MREIQFQVDGEVLRGHLHRPTGTNEKVPGIVLIPGFADTAVGPHNLHRAMADALASNGFAALRFDYRGQGESDGDFRAFTAQSGLDDARAALELLSRQRDVDRKRVGVIGFSLGGALACALAETRAEIRALVLLAPVAYPYRVFQTFFTGKHMEQAEREGWIDWLGWPVGAAFLAGTKALDPLRALQHSHAATLVMQGTADVEVSPENGAAYERLGATLLRLESGDHQFSSFRLQGEVIHHTITWFQSYLSLS